MPVYQTFGKTFSSVRRNVARCLQIPQSQSHKYIRDSGDFYKLHCRMSASTRSNNARFYTCLSSGIALLDTRLIAPGTARVELVTRSAISNGRALTACFQSCLSVKTANSTSCTAVITISEGNIMMTSERSSSHPKSRISFAVCDGCPEIASGRTSRVSCIATSSTNRAIKRQSTKVCEDCTKTFDHQALSVWNFRQLHAEPYRGYFPCMSFRLKVKKLIARNWINREWIMHGNLILRECRIIEISPMKTSDVATI